MRRSLMFALVAVVAARPAPATALPPAPGDPDSPVPDPTEPPPEDDPALEPAPDPGGAAEATGSEDSEFGPAILIEEIVVTGNTATRPEIIRRALPISVGEVLRASDKRLREARFKVLALGFFRDVALAVHKGSRRGRVIVQVHVIERGTLVLNRLWLGHTALTPWWLGTDVGDRNLFGLGVAVGGGFIFARHGSFAGARDQLAAELRIADPSVRGTRWGASWAGTLVRGSEPFRRLPSPATPGAETFDYRRVGARFGATYSANALTRLSLGLRTEVIDATLAAAPTQILPDGDVAAIDLHLEPGASRVVTASVAFDRDTRPDPTLPHSGSRVLISAELGGAPIGGDYDFATLFGSYERYWPVAGDRHAIAIKLSGGVVLGDAPRFDRIHVGDVDRMLTPRALGLVLSASAPLAILGTRQDRPTYGDLGGSAAVEYAYQLFRGSGKRRVYGGDVFVGLGMWGLAERADLRARDTGVVAALPIDLWADAGLRLDTDIGTFELSIANALGRLR